MKLNELFKPEQTASLQNYKDFYDNATQSMITRVKAGEHYHEVINQLAREFASQHGDSYEMFDLMADGLKKRHWEMFWDDEKKENEKETPVAIVVQPEEKPAKEGKMSDIDIDLKTLSDKDFDKYCSEIIKKIVNSYKEVRAFEVY